MWMKWKYSFCLYSKNIPTQCVKLILASPETSCNWKLNGDSNSISIEDDEKRMVHSRLLLIKTKNRFSTLGVEQNVERGRKERKKRTVNAKHWMKKILRFQKVIWLVLFPFSHSETTNAFAIQSYEDEKQEKKNEQKNNELRNELYTYFKGELSRLNTKIPLQAYI